MANNDELAAAYAQAQERHGHYIRMPDSCAARLGLPQGFDTFGVAARYALIRAFVAENQPVETAVDLGGNCGFVPLSLLGDGLIKQAVVYDVDQDILQFGERVADAMQLQERCEFVARPVALDTIDNLPAADLLICQNLIHHAGATFDQEAAKRMGWENYAMALLSSLRQKYKFGVIAMGFKSGKPRKWRVPKVRRAERFRSMLERSGWRVRHDRNVHDIVRLNETSLDGAPPDNGVPHGRLLSTAWYLGGSSAEKWLRTRIASPHEEKAAKYHLYLVE